MVVIDEPPHPQVLFAGFDAEDPGYQAMASLVPTARLLPANGFADLRAVEWDVLVARRVNVWAPGHVHVLAFGSDALGAVRTATGIAWVRYDGVQPSGHMTMPDSLPDALRRLVANELVPFLQKVESRPFLTVRDHVGTRGGLDLSPSDLRDPFVLDADGHMIAGSFARGEETGGGWCWALPHVPEHPELWLAAALQDWHNRTPHRVKALPGWRARPAWNTPREAATLAALENLRAERGRVLAEYATRETHTEADVTAAAAAADTGERLLLTAQGGDLVDAVAEALRALGFDVEDADGAPGPDGAPKVEDLRVSDPDDPSWTNITEVRGYKAGAKASDLQRLSRFAALYAVRTGTLPTTRWYVVNQFFGADPDTRRPPLAGGEDDVAVFAEDGGLVIDTRELFHLRRLVDDGTLASDRARVVLRGASGTLRPADVPGAEQAASGPAQ